MFGIGPLELVVILVVALLVFGPKRVPELARTVGRGLAEFRRASNDLRKTLALDELQQDLRRDLTGTQTIHRPEDRPAQAGDDSGLAEKPASDKASDKASDHASDHASDDASGHASDNAPNNARTTDVPAQETLTRAAVEQKHPGELPLGNDHEHHEESVDADLSADGETSSNTAADAELGNVPVSGSKSTDPRRG
jgi:TatA/E family protein of Tat protein translocase